MVARHSGEGRKTRPEAEISRNGHLVTKSLKKQKGLALLVFVTLLLTASAAMTVRAVSGTNTQTDRDKITAAALAQAKDALIGYAITYGDTHPGEVHGYLPCPDASGTALGGEGASEGNCGAKDISAIGRLPWKTLNLTPLRAGDNECLWYAVSGTYKYNIKTGLMNWDTNGQLQVYASDGTTLLTPADNQAVAVIFAPGAAAAGQDRSGTTAPLCGGNYTASNYLDAVGTFNNAIVSNVANASSQFRLGIPTNQTSDRMVFISKRDIWNALQKRNNFLSSLDNMTLKTAECIASFGTKNKIGGLPDLTNKSLPWPASHTLTDYSDNVRYNDINDLSSGRVPYRVNTARAQTGNSISSDYLLTKGTCDANNTNCVNNCPNPDNWANNIYPWWHNWKDQLFYAIGQKFEPGSSATDACDNDHCLHVNSSGRYAAVVIFAGQKLTGQTRASGVTDTQRGITSNYLEGRNASNIADSHSNGNENYQSDATSSVFNDIVYCIREDLNVVKGNPLATPACP